MRKNLKLFLLTGICISFINGYIHAQEQSSIASIEDLQKQVSNMEGMVSKQQKEIEGLKSKLESHYNAKNEGAGESPAFIREDLDQIVDKKIEDYFEKEENLDKLGSYVKLPLDMGYKKGFYLKTHDNRFSMKTNGQLQFRYAFEDFDSKEDSSSFRIRRGRLKFSGNAFNPKLKYALLLEVRSTGSKDRSKSVELLDFYGDVTHIPMSKIRFGQWKVPFNRQWITSSKNLQMVERSPASARIGEFNLGRQLGVSVYGDVLEKKLEYYLGFWNGNFRNESRNDNNEHLWIFRTSYNPFGPYGYTESDIDYSETPLAHISGAVAFDSEDDVTVELEGLGEVSADEIDKTMIVGELGFKYKGFSVLSEYYWRKRSGVMDANIIDQGFFIQGGYFLIPKKFEITGRYSLVDFDGELEADALREATFGINYFFAKHRSKLQFNAIRLDEETSGPDDIDYKYILQYQIAF